MLLAVVAVKCSEKTAREATSVAEMLALHRLKQVKQQPGTASKSSEKQLEIAGKNSKLLPLRIVRFQ
jgi:hypothetical protein